MIEYQVMDITNIGKKKVQLNGIDKKIVLKYVKEKRTSRTYIIGLGDFVAEDKIDEILRQLQKMLASGMNSVKNGDKYEYGFNGEHIERIKNYLMKEIKIPENQIKS